MTNTRNRGTGGNLRMDEHVHAATVEDVTFLVTVGGLLFEDACKRVGKKPDTVNQAFRRRGLPVPGTTTREDPT